MLTTISIATLKVFDIVRTATGGNFDTSVLAYEFYVQSFRSFNTGLGAALAVLLFVLVTPIVVYNIRQLRHLEVPMTIDHAADADPRAAGPMSPRPSARRKLTSPWASLVAVVIAVLWTVPTLGPVHLLLPARGRRQGQRVVDVLQRPLGHPRQLPAGADGQRHRPRRRSSSTRW